LGFEINEKRQRKMYEDRIAILVVSPPPKLLVIPSIARSTGAAQTEAVMNALKKWDIEPNVVVSVYDTTASNTGQ
jgi:hypothetical protein